ncbi:MAG: ROK family protein [Ruminococcaceae bacterium]|nr:ROK family protein [Oscillospiraceae bacterium]
MKICVCDIGGTNFRMAVFENGKISNIIKRPTPNFYKYSVNEIFERLVSGIAEDFRYLCGVAGEMNCLSLCFPGPTDKNGNALGSSVIFGDELESPLPLKKLLEERLHGVTVSVTNDITAASYRYMEKYDSFCLITVSSGIGNKVCIDRRVIIDDRGRTGEIGHIEYPINGFEIECTCGTGINHVGMISSGRGVEDMARRLAVKEKFGVLYEKSVLKEIFNGSYADITAEEVAKAADSGDEYARAVIDFCTVPLADVICTLGIAMDIPHFVIIGGFALNCGYYIESLRRNAVEKGIYNFSPEDIEGMIVLGEKDDDHGLIGSGIMMEEYFRNA